MLYEIDKGTVSTVDGGKVRVLTADGGITPPLSCSPALLALIGKGDAVVYLLFTDNTGVVVSKGDGTTGGGGSVVVDDHIDHDSENPVQNKVIAVALDGKADAADLASKADATALTAEVNRATAAESALQTAVDGKAPAVTYEQFTIHAADWTDLTGHDPFTAVAEYQATYSIGAPTLVELINNMPETFATYGLVIGGITAGGILKLWAITKPTADIVNVTVGFSG